MQRFFQRPPPPRDPYVINEWSINQLVNDRKKYKLVKRKRTNVKSKEKAMANHSFENAAQFSCKDHQESYRLDGLHHHQGTGEFLRKTQHTNIQQPRTKEVGMCVSVLYKQFFFVCLVSTLNQEEADPEEEQTSDSLWQKSETIVQAQRYLKEVHQRDERPLRGINAGSKILFRKITTIVIT